MKLTPRIAMEVAAHEAVVRSAYKDSVGVWTWSVGLTNATGHNVERYIGNPQSLARCLDVYIWALDRYAEDVREVFAGHDLSEGEFAAALSFHWNTGAIRRASWVDAWKRGDMADAEARFLQWRNPPEIVNRRKAEADLMFRGRWSSDGKMMEYGVTSRNTPDWGSARRVDAMPIIQQIMAGDAAMRPEDAPEVAPEPVPFPAAFADWLRQAEDDAASVVAKLRLIRAKMEGGQ